MKGLIATTLAAVAWLSAPIFAEDSAIKIADALQRLRETPCCAALNQIAYSELIYPGYISITDSDPVFHFGINGVSRFKAYKRPDCPRICRLTINSFGFDVEIPSKETAYAFFFPQVTLMDKDFNLIWTSENGEAVFQEPSKTEGWRLELSVDLASFPNASYILVHTGRQALLEGGEFKSYTPGVTVAVGTAFVTVGQSRGFTHVIGSPVTPDHVLDVRLDDRDPHPNLGPPFPME